MVDDSAPDRFAIKRSLKKYAGTELDFQQADSAAAALELLSTESYDGLIVDFYLRDLPGTELLRELRARYGELPCPVVMVTGSLESEKLAVQALEAGAHDYIEKNRLREPALWKALLYASSRFELAREFAATNSRLTAINSELERKNKLKTQFLANATHELRTPVTAIIGLVGLIRDHEGLPREITDHLASITACCDSLLNSVNDVLDLTKIETGEFVLERAAFCPYEIVQRVAQTFSHLADDKNIAIDTFVPDVVPYVYGDGKRVTQILMPLAGGDVKKLTSRAGFHDITFSKKGNNYVDLFSTVNSPPQVSLHNPTGERITWLLENKVDENHPLYPYLTDWIEPEFGSFLTSDEARLYYRLYKPKDFDPETKYPVIVYLYGGPGAQRVTNSWGRHFSQYMAQQGYVVFTLDNRGSYNRGKAFEEPIYHAMGTVEVADQVEGVKFLRTFPWVDPDRVGVHGSSYGGYMTIMTMFKEPEYFKAGVAGAPVTDWTLYDTHYTERYLGDPAEPGEVYKKSSVFDYAEGLKGPLLIYHGMADDNVLFKNSTKLYKLLQDNNTPFYVMDYPGKKHRFSGKTTSMHRLNMIRNFFDLHFGIKRKA